MRIELWCLVVVALWGAGLIMLEIVGKTKILGPQWNAGNREDTKQVFPAWIERTGRALHNHKENFPLFATAVLVVHLAGRSDNISAIAAVVYVAARATHGIVYIAGITVLRTLVFLIALAACLVIVSRLL